MEFLPIWWDGEKVYAGFWKRLKAALIDVMIAIPIMYCLVLLRRSDEKPLSVIAIILCTLFFSMYNVFLNARFGGSLGKLAIAIKVTKPDGSPIGWSEAWKRSSVDVTYAFLFLYVHLVPFFQISAQQYSTLAYWDRNALFGAYSPRWFEVAEVLQVAWFWSEPVVLLFNKRKRALHDFIGGTVVIHKRIAEQMRPPDRQATALAFR